MKFILLKHLYIFVYTKCNYVHLSGDVETATKVGKRHGKPKIFLVESGKMFADGYKFFRSVNGVWLTEHVPAQYLKERF